MEEESKLYFPIKDVIWPKPVRGSAKSIRAKVVDARYQVFYVTLIELLSLYDLEDAGYTSVNISI